MSRKLTTYTQPSIAERLATAPTIEDLSRLWGALGRRVAAGQIDADEKTMQRWVAACWLRVEELIANAQTPGEACYVFNVTLRWPKPAGVERRLRSDLERVVRALPSDAERLKAQGVVIQGVTA